MTRPRRIAVVLASLLLLASSSAYAQKKKKGGKKKKGAQTTQPAETKGTDTKGTDGKEEVDLDAPKESKPTETAPAAEKPIEKTPETSEGGEGAEEKKDDGSKGPITLAGALGFALPLGTYSKITGLGLGLYFDGEYKISHLIRPTIRLGLQYHFDTTRTPQDNGTSYSTEARAHAIPILIGARFYPVENLGFYGFAETGIFIRFVSELRVGAQSTTLAGCEKVAEGVECSATKANLGLGVGAGWVFGPVDVRASFHTYDVSAFGARLALGLTGGFRFANF